MREKRNIEKNKTNNMVEINPNKQVFLANVQTFQVKDNNFQTE